MIGGGCTYVVLINRQDKPRTIDAIEITSSGKTVAPTLQEAVQVIHRSDMDLADAMQNTKRCERVEMVIKNQPLTMAPYSITPVRQEV